MHICVHVFVILCVFAISYMLSSPSSPPLELTILTLNTRLTSIDIYSCNLLTKNALTSSSAAILLIPRRFLFPLALHPGWMEIQQSSSLLLWPSWVATTCPSQLLWAKERLSLLCGRQGLSQPCHLSCNHRYSPHGAIRYFPSIHWAPLSSCRVSMVPVTVSLVTPPLVTVTTF